MTDKQRTDAHRICKALTDHIAPSPTRTRQLRTMLYYATDEQIRQDIAALTAYMDELEQERGQDSKYGNDSKSAIPDSCYQPIE